MSFRWGTAGGPAMTTTRIDTVRGADGPPPPPRAGRSRLVGAALIVLSLAAALSCYFVFTTWLPNDRTLYREYKAAEACPARRVIPRSEDCLRKVTFTVEGTRKSTKNMRATLLGPEPFPRVVVPFGDRGPVLSGLQQGDRVTGTVWRGVVVVVAEGDVRRIPPTRLATNPRWQLPSARSRGCWRRWR